MEENTSSTHPATPKRNSSETSKADAEESARPAKRGKYVKKACEICQKRKIKCDGGFPCSRCKLARLQCKMGSLVADTILSDSSDQSIPSRSEQSTSEAIMARLISVERQLQMIGRIQQSSPLPQRTPILENQPDLTGDSSQTFVGEMTVFHSLEQPATNPQHIDPTPKSPSTIDLNPVGWLHAIMSRHRVVPQRSDLDHLLAGYFALIYILNPFLHRHWLEQKYKELWQESFYNSDEYIASNLSKRVSTAIVFLCLACAASQESSRMDPDLNCYSAGFNLYSVALELLQPILDLTRDQIMSLQSLQALAMASLYLFRLDASVKAERLLAYTISSAHTLGLHRKSTYKNMFIYEEQLFCRLWWMLYTHDRRVSVETGRPLVIQDFNVSTQRPLNVSDEWLEKFKSIEKTRDELVEEISIEEARQPITSIPYLNANISYCKVISTMWKSLYGADSALKYPQSIACDCLDALIATNKSHLPRHLRYDPRVSFAEQFEGLEWWQMKHALLLHMRYKMLRLVLRRGAFTSSNMNDDDDVITQTECIATASELVMDYLKIPSKYPRYVFPHYHYLMSVTMIMISVVIKNSSFKTTCKQPILQATQALIEDCSKSWISGKMMRNISRISKMVQSGLLWSGNERSRTAILNTSQSASVDADKISSNHLVSSPTIPSLPNTRHYSAEMAQPKSHGLNLHGSQSTERSNIVRQIMPITDPSQPVSGPSMRAIEQSFPPTSDESIYRPINTNLTEVFPFNNPTDKVFVDLDFEQSAVAPTDSAFTGTDDSYDIQANFGWDEWMFDDSVPFNYSF